AGVFHHGDIAARTAPHAARRHARLRDQRRNVFAGGVFGNRRGCAEPAVRALLRSDERRRDVQRRPLHGARAHDDRVLRSRFQPRVSPVVRLRSAVRLSRASPRKSAAGGHSRRRTAGAVTPRSVVDDLQTVLDDEPLNLARAALVIARLEYPSLEPEPWLATIAALGAEAEARLAPASALSLRARVALLNALIFDEHGFAGNTAHYDDFRNSCLNVVLERRLGIPITL